MKRHYMITLASLPFLFISCMGQRDAVDDNIMMKTGKPDAEAGKEVDIPAERIALIDSVVFIRANDALNHLLMAQGEASKGNIEKALENTTLSLEIFATSDAMIFKGALLSALGRKEEADYWLKKASTLDSFSCF